MRFLFVTLASSWIAFPLSAQVEHKREWAPVREVIAQAPPPSDLEAREKRFAERNSPAAIKALAGQLFGLMNPDYQPENDKHAALYRQAWEHFRAGRYAQALESYKLFSFARMREPEAGVKVESSDPSKRVFIEFYNTPDELMKGVFRLQMFDKPIPEDISVRGTDSIINYYRAGMHNAHMIDVVLQNGQPGRMNWTWMPPDLSGGTWHLPTDEAFVAYAYRTNTCFASLLAAYMEKADPRYLEQWIGYLEDMYLNYDHDLEAAGLKVRVSPAGANAIYLRHLAYLILNSPTIDKDFPAATYARIVLHHWLEDLPLIIIGSRSAGANRVMHMYGALLTEARMNYPEFVGANTLLEERRRLLEAYGREYMMPDGSSVDYAPNYNKNFLLLPPTDFAYLQAMKNPPSWFTPQWEAEMRREMGLMARYLTQAMAPDGTYPGYKDPLRDLAESSVGPQGYMSKCVPEALVDPRNEPVVKNLLARAAVADPGFTSQAFPYGGYYLMRENWSPEARFLYFHDFRPGENGLWRHHKNIFVQAFGQRMLNAFRWESPLLVDGAGHMYQPLTDLYPESYGDQRGLFGSHSQKSAWQEPLPNRWFTSPLFDLTEGSLRIPFAERFADKPPIFIDDVAHDRQVFFLREAGAWIVVDRVAARDDHEYQILWGFEADRIVPKNWDTDWRNRGKQPPAPRENAYSSDQIQADPAAGAIRTASPTRPNLSIYHAASTPLNLKQGEILQNDDAMFGNTFRAGPTFKGHGPFVVASLLYPRRAGAPDIKSFQPVKSDAFAGFDAQTPEGFLIAFRAAPAPTDFTLEGVQASASSLLVSVSPARALSGIALDCSKFSLRGKSLTPPGQDFEFVEKSGGEVVFTPIFRPMAPVRILPSSDVFLGSVDVTFEHPEKDVDIHYTVDGSEPGLKSPIFTKPVRLDQSATVRAVAIRRQGGTPPPNVDGTLQSAPASAFFRRVDAYWPAASVKNPQPGLAARYYEDDWSLSLIKLPILQPLASGVAASWMDTSLKRESGKAFAFDFSGYLKVPQDGVYTFHGPWEMFDVGEQPGYDLIVEVDGQRWNPATRAHGHATWSVPLAEGYHAINLRYVDLRPAADEATFEFQFDGEKPEVLLSGPDLPAAPVPSAWLFHQPK